MSKKNALVTLSWAFIALAGCSQSPISEADARVVALERLRDPETYKLVGYDPALMPEPKMQILTDGYWYVWDDSLQAVSVTILVHYSGSTEVSYKHMDGYKDPWRSK